VKEGEESKTKNQRIKESKIKTKKQKQNVDKRKGKVIFIT
jgi:hypothetical protein